MSATEAQVLARRCPLVSSGGAPNFVACAAPGNQGYGLFLDSLPRIIFALTVNKRITSSSGRFFENQASYNS